MANKVDSNITGLRFAEEVALRQLSPYTPAVAAQGVLTFTGTGTQGDTITVGSRTYELRGTFDSDEDEIIIGGTAAETAANVALAINSGASGGIVGAGTLAHATVTAQANGAAVVITARTAGVAGNSIATTETSGAASFATVTLTGGAAAVGTPPVWYPLEPNSYADFGGQIATVARNPINPSRQRKKGVTTDLDASGGFNQDLTTGNTTRIMQGFFFADAREKYTTAPMNAAQVAMGAVAGTAGEYGAGAGLAGLVAGDLILASGFSVAANNGLKTVNATSDATTVEVVGALTDEASPPADAKLQLVGHTFATSETQLQMNGDLVRLVFGTTNPTTLPLIAGEWVFVGGDAAGSALEDNAGFARVRRVGANYIEFDKVSWAPSATNGTGVALQLFYGDVIRNEPDPENIKRRTYHVERTLGKDDAGTMAEYLVGAVPNEFSMNIPQADKVTIDLSFVAVDNEQRTGAQGVKPGTRVTLQPQDAFNTSSDFARIKLALVREDASIQPLFAFATELTLTVNNNVTPNKAVGVLGAFDTSAGTFEVGGSLTAYFANIEAVQAVRNNDSVTLDIIMLKAGKALLFDVPLLSLGDGRLGVEQDQAITLPLETNAAESVFGNTLLFQSFAYVPEIAG